MESFFTCKPLTMDDLTNGAIFFFYFNNFSNLQDTFVLYRNNAVVPWTYKGVAWSVDQERRFRNPLGDNLELAFAVIFLLFLPFDKPNPSTA